MKSFYLPLIGNMLLQHFGTPSRPLDLKTSLPLSKSIFPIEVVALPQRQPLCRSSTFCKCTRWIWNADYSLTVSASIKLLQSLSLSLKTDCCYSLNRSGNKSNHLSVSSHFSITTSISSYNPVLEPQWRRLKLNQWLGSSLHRSMWFSRWFLPCLN